VSMSGMLAEHDKISSVPTKKSSRHGCRATSQETGRTIAPRYCSYPSTWPIVRQPPDFPKALAASRPGGQTLRRNVGVLDAIRGLTTADKASKPGPYGLESIDMLRGLVIVLMGAGCDYMVVGSPLNPDANPNAARSVLHTLDHPLLRARLCGARRHKPPALLGRARVNPS
jgi:hypothetical protein